jgi:hypothetical protein
MREPTCITSTMVKTAVIAISTISVTAMPMIFRLIDSVIKIISRSLRCCQAYRRCVPASHPAAALDAP